MSLVTRNPFALLNDLQRVFDDTRIFPALTGGGSALNNLDWQPAVDIHEDKDGYHVAVDLPGIKPEEIEVTTHNNVLSIRGSRNAVHPDKEQKRSERIFGSFLREFSMPENADLEQIAAKSNHGVLEIFVPKTTKPEPRRISVQ